MTKPKRIVYYNNPDNHLHSTKLQVIKESSVGSLTCKLLENCGAYKEGDTICIPKYETTKVKQ